MKFSLFGRDDLLTKFIYGLAAVMYSAVIFIYFGARNTSEFSLKTIAILTCVFSITAALSYLISLIIFRRALAAFAFNIICWTGFYFGFQIMQFLNDYWPFDHGIAVVVTAIIFLAACITALKLKSHTPPPPPSHKAIYMFIGVLAVIFALNCTTLVRALKQTAEARNLELPIKKNFNINKNLSSPNIYWIHADGMLSFNAVAKYFNDNQEKFLNELEQRGFEINKGAAFEAHHSTTNAIPVLMNPYSYDNWIRNEFLKPSEELNNYAFDLLRMNNELQYAFQAKSYDINVTGPYKFYYPIRGGKFWLTAVTKGDILSLEDLNDNVFLEADNFRNIYFGTILKEILKRIKFSDQTYKAFISPDKRQEILVNAWDLDNRVWDFVDALYDILYGKYPEPRLTIIHDLTPHVAFNHAEDGSHADVPFSKYNKHRPLDYYPQHVWSAKVLINIIDLILEQDPDAVIIIQSDHGIHANSEQDFKQAFGDKFNSNTTKELWNSTMSAIRVPDKFKTGEEHYALNNPLNITRYLVNNFVGANNYEYLSPNAKF